jgi:hypothetical protein
MFILFCIAEMLAGMFLIVLGAGMIESPETAVVIIGAATAFVGILVMFVFGMMLNSKLKGEIL